MPIRQQLLVFTSSVVILAMLIVAAVSSVVFRNLLTHSAMSYLETASYSAEELLQSRREQVAAVVARDAEKEDLYLLLETGEETALTARLLEYQQLWPFIDFGVFLDADGTPLACLPEQRRDCGAVFSPYLPMLEEEDAALSGMALLPIDSLFQDGSAAAAQWQIPLEDGEGAYEQALANLVAVPVRGAAGQLCGYLLLGEIINHNTYYPTEYSQNVMNSFLTIAADNIRVCSNLPESDTHYLGTTIPEVVQSGILETGSYFGAEQAPIGENYFFRYQTLYGLSGEPVGCMAVGIEEPAYMSMIRVNQLIIFAIVLLMMPCIILLSGIISSRISRPIVASSEIARRITQEDFSVLETTAVPEHTVSEPEILLKSIQEMAVTLKRNRDDIRNYVQELNRKNERALQLTEELEKMNEHLERMVDARTLELSQTVKALEESNRVKSAFLANVSHELRTPLSSNISASELLLDEIFGTLNEKQKKYVKNIWLGSNHLLQLINDILDISKIDAGKTNVNLAEFPVRDVFEEALAVVKSLAYQKEIRFFVSIEPPALRVCADRLLLKQILYNLLSNAIKFSEPGKRIWLSALLDEGRQRVCFSVKDEGIGIRERDLQRVFREFEQVDNSYSREYGGTGLGLPLSQKQVELHGGKIELHSVFGQGTEAAFWLPLHPVIEEKEKEHGEDSCGG